MYSVLQARNTASAHEDLGTYLAFDSLTEKQRFDALAFRGNIFMTSGQLDAALKDLQAARALSSGSQATMRDIDAQIKKIKQPKVDKRRYRPNASPYEVCSSARRTCTQISLTSENSCRFLPCMATLRSLAWLPLPHLRKSAKPIKPNP